MKWPEYLGLLGQDADSEHHEEQHSQAPIPAATVAVLRDGETGLEALMLHRNSKIAFGGMWVFPGGRVDDTDAIAGADGRPDELATAAAAAAREASEEAGVVIDPSSLVWFSHWVPPPITPKRYSTFFFAVQLDNSASPVTVDKGEITAYEWMKPVDAIVRRDNEEIELAPPTWMTLNQLGGFPDARTALSALNALEPTFYKTRLVRTDEGLVAMWEGDAGYESGDPSQLGPRHRLTMAEDRYSFQDDRT